MAKINAKFYTLADNEGKVFYVGYTSLDINIRMRGHISEANGTGTGFINQAKAEKIRSIKYQFVVTVVEQKRIQRETMKLCRKEAAKIEIGWIKKLQAEGHNLTNVRKTKKPVYKLIIAA